MKIITIIGARPQFVKAAILSSEIKNHKDVEEVLIHTGQHYDFEMSKLFFDELDIPLAKYNLDINQGNHATQTGNMLIELENIIIDEKPDCIIVYGDTNSTLAGALVGSKLHIPIIHVEAGCRSFDKEMPEEINRICTDHVSSILFCSTQNGVSLLSKEGIVENVYNVGDVMFDAVLKFVEIAEKKSKILMKLGLGVKEYFLATVHRASNTDSKENLELIFDAFIESNELIVLPIHPRTRKKLEEFNLWDGYQGHNIKFIKPVGYLDMLILEKNASKILTDSGGIQKEAYFFKVPCITLRDTSEWIETIKDWWNILVHTDREKILSSIKSFNPCSEQNSYFGNGDACKKIVERIKKIIK